MWRHAALPHGRRRRFARQQPAQHRPRDPCPLRGAQHYPQQPGKSIHLSPVLPARTPPAVPHPFRIFPSSRNCDSCACIPVPWTDAGRFTAFFHTTGARGIPHSCLLMLTPLGRRHCLAPILYRLSCSTPTTPWGASPSSARAGPTCTTPPPPAHDWRTTTHRCGGLGGARCSACGLRTQPQRHLRPRLAACSHALAFVLRSRKGEPSAPSFNASSGP